VLCGTMTSMPVPVLVPIADEGDEHIAAVGRYSDGLYLGLVFADRRQWVACLLTFTADGLHEGSRMHGVPMDEPGMGTSETYKTEAAELAAMLATLNGRTADDIAVRPFSTADEDFTVALVVNDEHGFADLLPVGIRFSAPWDGGYST
jgi:hypothetical protein